jgi:hypothetical protein
VGLGTILSSVRGHGAWLTVDVSVDAVSGLALTGSYLGSQIGLPATLVVGVVGMLVAFVPLLASSIPGLRQISEA